MGQILLIGPGSGLAKAIGLSMSKMGYRIYGCVRTLQAFGNNQEIEQIAFKEILSDKFKIKFDFVINCANYRDWSNEETARYFTSIIPGLIMDKLSSSGSSVINFGTYLQFSEVPKEASLYQYAEAKKQLSEKIQSLPHCSEFVLYTLYGVGDHPNSMINHLMRSIKEDIPVHFSPGNQLIALTKIQDVANVITKFSREDLVKNFSCYSLWPTPAISIREVVSIFESEVGLKAKINWGARPYAGHEIFEYDPNNFPKQYNSTDWTNLGSGLSDTYRNIFHGE